MKRQITLTIFAAILAAGNVWAHGDGPGKQADKHSGSAHGETLGKPGDPGKVSRTIEIEMGDDMRFKPANVTVKRGETIRFVAKNTGKIKHEMVLGTMKELKAHAELMRKFPGMEHDDPNAVSVEPGKTGTFVWQFTKAGTFDFACLEPGHFEAGMIGKVIVAKAAVSKQSSSAAK
ncbi:MAG: cupredoxin family protein [Burkholderiales bacterium]|nr:cupredoxin family protein [Burkholderiales bacterium]